LLAAISLFLSRRMSVCSVALRSSI
jgi:hypothetical protein